MIQGTKLPAAWIAAEPDGSKRDYLAHWLAARFALDNASFKCEEFLIVAGSAP